MYKPMRNIILADLAEVRASLLPLTYTRPIADLQTGLLTTRLRWETLLPGHYSYLTVDYLDPIFKFSERPYDGIAAYPTRSRIAYGAYL